MFRRMSSGLLCCIVGAVVAAEPAWEPLPDPYGLGQRLVIIDRLRELGVAVPERASDERLLALYRQALDQATVATVTPVAVPTLIDGTVDEAARRRDAVARLRQTLKQRHGIETPADADEDDLRAQLADLTQQTEQRRQEAAERFMEVERQRAASEAAAAELGTVTDGSSGITWVMPTLASRYEDRRSPYAICLFGRERGGALMPLQMRLVVFLPEPPSGEPRIALLGGDRTLPLSGFSFTATPTTGGMLRAEIGFTVPSAGTREAIALVIDQADTRVEYRIGQRTFLVPLDDDQRSAMRAVIGTYTAER